MPAAATLRAALSPEGRSCAVRGAVPTAAAARRAGMALWAQDGGECTGKQEAGSREAGSREQGEAGSWKQGSRKQEAGEAGSGLQPAYSRLSWGLVQPAYSRLTAGFLLSYTTLTQPAYSRLTAGLQREAGIIRPVGPC